MAVHSNPNQLDGCETRLRGQDSCCHASPASSRLQHIWELRPAGEPALTGV
jgi:hypothetical protein